MSDSPPRSRPKSPFGSGEAQSTKRSMYKRHGRLATYASSSSGLGGNSRRGRSDEPTSSMVVDYYYHMHHFQAEDEDMMKDRKCSFGSIGLQPKEEKRCFVISPIGVEGSEV